MRQGTSGSCAANQICCASAIQFSVNKVFGFVCLFVRPGVLSVHPAGAAPRHRPAAGRRGEGEGGGGRAGGPAVAAPAPLTAAQQLAAPADGGQGRAVRGGGRGEEGQRRGVHGGQLLLPHHSRVHRRQGKPAPPRRTPMTPSSMSKPSSVCVHHHHYMHSSAGTHL